VITLRLILTICVLMATATAFAQPESTPYDHTGAEIDADLAPAAVPGETPIVHQPHYRGERELFDYNPRFMPTGRVAFDLQNRPLIRAADPVVEQSDGAGDGWVQTLRDGQWVGWWLPGILREQFPDWTGPFVAGVRDWDTRIMVDGRGDAWTVISLSNPGGRRVLMRLPVGEETWQIHEVPDAGALRLEENARGSDEPPVLVEQSRRNIFIRDILRADDGSITITESVRIAPEGSFLNPGHSGAGPTAATVGERTWVTFARIEPELGDDGEPLPGTPNYVACYDRTTGEVSEPALIGFGQNPYRETPDAHNAGAIVADSDGGLHVVIGAHQHHFWYVRSAVDLPLTAEDWTEPEALGLRRRWDCGFTYVALAIDDDDTLHLVGRNMGRGVDLEGRPLPSDEINNEAMTRTLDYLRATPQPDGTWKWEEMGPLLVSFHRGYSIFYHKLSIDRRGRLFLSYYLYAAQITDEMAEAYHAKWPDETLQQNDEGKWSGFRPHDPVILMSDDGGDTWRIATTEDFEAGIIERK
jgi:hypothetical protein